MTQHMRKFIALAAGTVALADDFADTDPTDGATSAQPGVRRKRRKALRRLCDRWNSATGKTMRGSGLHHRAGWPGLYQGKMPLR